MFRQTRVHENWHHMQLTILAQYLDGSLQIMLGDIFIISIIKKLQSLQNFIIYRSDILMICELCWTIIVLNNKIK